MSERIGAMKSATNLSMSKDRPSSPAALVLIDFRRSKVSFGVIKPKSKGGKSGFGALARRDSV